MKTTSSTLKKRPARTRKSTGADPTLDRIVQLVASLRTLQQQMVIAATPVVHGLIQRRSRDEKEIEHLLDRLLDLACIPEGLALFKTLCRYYYGISPAYVYAYRDMWDSDAEPEEEAAS